MKDKMIKIVQGDITTLAVDAIVNAANDSIEVIFCCFSERYKNVYENVVRIAG